MRARTRSRAPLQLAAEVELVAGVVMLKMHEVQLLLGFRTVPAAAQDPRPQIAQEGPPRPAAQMATVQRARCVR